MTILFAPGRALLSSRGPFCQRCLIARLRRSPYDQARRNVGTKYLQKMKVAEEEWQQQAERIKNGEEQGVWDILEERGYIKDTAGSRENIRELLRTKRIGAYVGIDPTASSMHIGHLLPLMPLFWMYMHGYWTYSLIGGATAKIGDPTGRTESRGKISRADMTMNMTKIHYQLKKIWASVEVQARRHGYERKHAWRRGIQNNNAWWNKEPLLEILQRIGHALRMGPMLSRDSVKLRMGQGDGMSFAEFAYPIMQGWDWWKLFSSPLRVQMQIGGSDQYGNIVSGIEIIKSARANEPNTLVAMPADSPLDDPVGFTVPILTDKSGKKFGKSAGNAIWLDPYQTSMFDLYGYFVRRPDDAVENLLKLFTFLPMAEIQKTMAAHNADPAKRTAQHVLAYEVLTLIHGEDEAKKTQAQHQDVYAKNKGQTGSIAATTTTSSEDVYETDEKHPTTPFNAPRIDLRLPESLVLGKSIARILYAARLCRSVSEGNRIAATQGAYVGGSPGQKPAVNKGMTFGSLEFTPVKLWFPQETKNFLIDGKLLILRKGKHNIRVVEMVSDDEYIESGEKYPGQPFTGRVRKLRARLKALQEGKEDVGEDLDDDELLLEEGDKRKEKEKEGEGEGQKSSQLVFPDDRLDNKIAEHLKQQIKKEIEKRKSAGAEKAESEENKEHE